MISSFHLDLFDSHLARRIETEVPQAPGAGPKKIKIQHFEMAELSIEGHSPPEIARLLGYRSVQHVQNLLTSKRILMLKALLQEQRNRA